MRRVYGILLFLSITLFAWGEKGDIRSINIRTVAFDYFKENKSLTVLNAGKIELINIPKNNLSQPISYRGESSIMVYPQDYKEGVKPFGAVSIPEDLNSVILLFLPLKERYHIEVINDNIKDFPGGSKYFVNLSKHHVASKMGERYIAVAPGKQELITMGEDKKTRVHVQIAYDKGGPWHPLSSTRWTFDPRTRTILFFYYDERLKRLRLKGIPDRVQ